MGIKKILAKPFSSYEVKKFLKANLNPLEAQMRVFENLISTAKDTNFGKDHPFEQIKNHTDFTNTVPVRDYEDLKAYIQLIIDGNQDVLWPGAPKYFAKTSGTTSGIKYIPITDVSIKQQVKAARMALQFYIHQTKNTNWVEGKMIFLQGSPELDKKGAINAGRLSGIVYHEVPKYLLSNRLPSLQTNIIEDSVTFFTAFLLLK